MRNIGAVLRTIRLEENRIPATVLRIVNSFEKLVH
jgi:hypothetical protein